MKRPISAVSDTSDFLIVPKKIKPSKGHTDDDREAVEEMSKQVDAVLLDQNLLYEILKHVDDARTLASAARVSKQWSKTAQDERLWELICTKHSAGRYQQQQLRSVVLALGGFRRLFSLYLWPLLKPSSSSSPPPSTAWPCLPLSPAPSVPARSAGGKMRWGKDEVNLSLSLLSISYYGKMNFNNPKGK